MSILTTLQEFTQTVVLPAFLQLQYDLEAQGKSVLITGKASTENEIFNTLLREIHNESPFLEDFLPNIFSNPKILETREKWVGYSIILSNQDLKSKNSYEATYGQSIIFKILDENHICVDLLAYHYASNYHEFFKYIYPVNEGDYIAEIDISDVINLSLESIDYFDYHLDTQENNPLDNSESLIQPSSPQINNLVQDTLTLSNSPSQQSFTQEPQNTTTQPEPADPSSENLAPEDLPPQQGFAPHLKQAIHEFLGKFTIPDNLSLFQTISDAGYARLHTLVENSIAHKPSTPEDYVAAYELAEHHAIAYALSQKPSSLDEFADYFEFYQVTLHNECQSKLDQCRSHVQTLAQQESNLTTLTQESSISFWQQASHELLNQTYDDEESTKVGIFITEVEQSKRDDHPEAINAAIQKDTERTFRLIAEKFGRRNSYGTREKLVFCSIDASLKYEGMLFMIQHHNSTNTLRFELETTAVLQVSKFFNELPPEEQNIGKNYVDSYLRSAKSTIENPTEPIVQELDIEGNFVFVFKRQLQTANAIKMAEARVGVTKIYGRLTLLSYAILNANSSVES